MGGESFLPQRRGFHRVGRSHGFSEVTSHLHIFIGAVLNISE